MLDWHLTVVGDSRLDGALCPTLESLQEKIAEISTPSAVLHWHGEKHAVLLKGVTLEEWLEVAKATEGLHPFADR